jgi:threonyl-tRNA synthetase
LITPKPLFTELRSHRVRADADFSNDPVKAKIATAEERKIHTMLGKGNLGAKPRGEVVASLLEAIHTQAAS